MKPRNGKIIVNGMVCLLLFTLSVLLFLKGIELKTFDSTGQMDGITIELLSIELFDQVPVEKISEYGNGFLITSVFTLMMAIFPIGEMMRTIWNSQYSDKKDG